MRNAVCLIRQVVQILLLLNVSCLNQLNQAGAATHFASDYPCTDSKIQCIGGGGVRVIEGMAVYRDCWEWGYEKACNYPSKDDCRRHSDCYPVRRVSCLLKDKYDNCVNWQEEYSCEIWQPEYVEVKEASLDTVAKAAGSNGLLCRAAPCIDGNCVDKSYQMDSSMMESISLLAALRLGQNIDGVFNIFRGQGMHCSNKVTSYTNCCKIGKAGGGWGSDLGAKCNSEEQYLSQKRAKNLCVYVGKKSHKTAGVTTLTKHYYCCFGTILEKVIQVQGRRQLGMGFGSGDQPDCRGFNLEELERINWDEIDFSEFAAEIYSKLSVPNVEEIADRVRGGIIGIEAAESAAADSGDAKSSVSNKSGINAKLKVPVEDQSYGE